MGPKTSLRRAIALAVAGFALVVVPVLVAWRLAAPGDRERAPREGGRAATPRAEPPTAHVAVRVPMESGPTGVAFGHGRLWVTHDDGTVARIAPRTGRLLGRTRVGRFPVRVAVGRDAAWVVDDDTGMLSELDVRDGRLRRRTHVCDLPSGVAVTHGSVWVVCSLGQLVRVDARTARVTATTRPAPAAADPPDLVAAGHDLWVAGRNRVLRVDARTGAVTASVAVPSPADVAAGSGAVWVASFDTDTVTRVDPRRAVVTGTFRVGVHPSGVTLTRDAVWVLNNGDSTVVKLDARSGKTLTRIPVGPHSYDIAAQGEAVWVQSYGAQSLFRIRPPGPGSGDLST